MPVYAGIIFRAGEDGTAPNVPEVSQVQEALKRFRSNWWSADAGALRLRMRAAGPVIRNAVVMKSPRGVQPNETSSETLAYLIALDAFPWPATLIAYVLATAALLSSSATVGDWLAYAGAIAAALLVVRWAEQQTGLAAIRASLQRAFGKQSCAVRRIETATAPESLRAALRALRSAAPALTVMPIPKPSPQPKANATAPAALVEGDVPTPPSAARPFVFNAALISSLMPAIVSGIFSVTTAVIVFGLEDARRISEREQRAHELELEEVRSQRPLAMEAVQYYLEHQEELAAGDARAQRTMAILRSVAPPEVFCVIAEAYAQTAQTPETSLPLYNETSLWRVVEQARTQAFGQTQVACLGSSTDRQVAIEGRVEGYTPPSGGGQFERHPTGGGGEIPETDPPREPEGRTLLEASILVFAPSGARALQATHIDALAAAGFSVAGVFSAAAPRAPVVVYYRPEERAAAELLAAFADYWTYEPGGRSAVRVVQAPAANEEREYLELWLPR